MNKMDKSKSRSSKMKALLDFSYGIQSKTFLNFSRMQWIQIHYSRLASRDVYWRELQGVNRSSYPSATQWFYLYDSQTQKAYNDFGEYMLVSDKNNWVTLQKLTLSFRDNFESVTGVDYDSWKKSNADFNISTFLSFLFILSI